MANFLPFKFGRKNTQEETFKAIAPGDAMHVDEQGRHLIFRTIGGRVRPIRVGAEEFAEWLLQQNVNIDPADQKTLRELDKELEIMERAAEYGGPALQKQYEDYFRERREQYSQLASQYYQTALQNQAQANQLTAEQLMHQNQSMYEESVQQEDGSVISRSDLPDRGWGTSLQMWVSSQDQQAGLTPAHDDWYYNRIMSILVNPLVNLAKEGVSLAEINIDNMFSHEYVHEAIRNHYDDFFAGAGADPKKVVAAVKTVQEHYNKNLKDNQRVMGNFISYWYNRMSEDFEREQSTVLESSPVTEAMESVPEGVIPAELPETFTRNEAKSLIGMYKNSTGSKLNAAHRVMLHSMSRVIDSIPMNEMVATAVELSSDRRGLNATHREGYKRAYHDYANLGLMPNRDSLVEEAITIINRISEGTTRDKVEGMKRVSMILGAIDGAAVLSSNPGIQEAQFTRKWHDSAINAGRVRSEGPGLVDVLLDDQKREMHTYTNEDLKIVHGKKPDSPSPQAEEEISVPSDESGSAKYFEALSSLTLDFLNDYVKGNKILTPTGYGAMFNPTSQGYTEVVIETPGGEGILLDARINTPPVNLAELNEKERSSYVEYIRTELARIIEEYEKSIKPKDSEEDEFRVDSSEGSFRVPIFDFKENLTHTDRDFIGDIIQHVDEGNLSVDKITDNIYRITNPQNGKMFDIIMNTAKKKLVGAARDQDGNIVPFSEPSIQDFTSSLEYRSSA